MPAELVHFKIGGDALTGIARDVWQDGDYNKAVNLLVSSLPGLVEAQAIAICEGRSKLVGDEYGMEIEDDNASNVTAMEALDRLSRQLADERTLVRDLAHGPVGVPSPWGMIKVPLSWTETYTRFGRTTVGIRRDISWDDVRFQPYATDYQNSNRARFPALAQAIDDMPAESDVVSLLDSLPRQDVPTKPDPTLSSLNAWVDPGGRFYPCRYMEHSSLACSLGQDEAKLEKAGWIKISDSKDQNSIVKDRDDVIMPSTVRPTQRQMDAVFAWCEKHKRSFPKHLFDDLK